MSGGNRGFSSKQMSDLDSQVKQVTDVMKSNVAGMMEREDKLNNVLSSTGEMQDSANMFQQNAKRIQRKTWLQNMKMKIILGVVIFIVPVIIILIILWQTGVFSGGSSKSSSTSAPKTT